MHGKDDREAIIAKRIKTHQSASTPYGDVAFVHKSAAIFTTEARAILQATKALLAKINLKRLSLQIVCCYRS